MSTIEERKSSQLSLISFAEFDLGSPRPLPAIDCLNTAREEEALRSDFWNLAHKAADMRRRTESWTHDDCLAAVLQCNLLSYASGPDGVDKFGPRNSPSAPQDWLHNCPWNDWTPPSRSRRLFAEAAARKKPELIDQRVRVRLCSSAENVSPANSVLAFATVERGNKTTEWCLRLRRGATILATIAIEQMQVVRVNKSVVALMPRSRTHQPNPRQVACLSFENDARMDKFQMMLVNAVS